jgi:hydroxymethyl cephem carbamoyltransferase
MEKLARRIFDGGVVAWVQGRYEIGPRALGHRSLLASPLIANNRRRLNEIKHREDYRPVAPCVLADEVDRWFDAASSDPYMLYFARVLTDRLPAVTHVDGTARIQAVDEIGDAALKDLLRAFRCISGVGVLCNTSLNFRGHGFLNRMSELIEYCSQTGITDIVVDGDWYTSRGSHAAYDDRMGRM